MSTADRSQLRGRAARWLLDIETVWGILRFSDRPVSVTDTRGNTYQYAGGLSPLTVSLGADIEALPIEVYSEAAEWVLHHARGQSVEEAPVTLRRWHEGLTLELAYTIAVGALREVQIGDPAAPGRMRASLDANRRRMSEQVPTGEAQVNAQTWSDPDQAIEGVHYPIVLGIPGYPTGAAAVPALAVQGNRDAVTVFPVKFLIGDGRIQASSATLTDLTSRPRTNEVHDVVVQKDNAGREISYLSVSNSTALTMEPGRSFFVGFSSDTGGGARARDGDRPIRGLGEVLRYLYETYTTVAIDAAEMEARRAELDVFKIDTAIMSPVYIDDWVRAEILGKFPVRLVEGRNGVYFARERYTATRQEVTLHLNANRASGGGVRVERVSGLQKRDGAIVNHLTVSYAPDAASGRMKKLVIVSHENNASHAKWYPSYLAAMSHASYGHKPLERQLGVLWDDATAALVARSIIARDSLPRHGTQVSAPPELESTRIGTVVAYTDDSLHYAERLARVDNVIPGPGAALLDLTFMSDPTRTNVRTS